MDNQIKYKLSGFLKFLGGIPLWLFLIIAVYQIFQIDFIGVTLYIMVIAITIWFNNTLLIIYDKQQETLTFTKVWLSFIKKPQTYKIENIKFVVNKEYTGAIYKVNVIKIIDLRNNNIIFKKEDGDLGFSKVKDLMLKLGYEEANDLESDTF